MNNYSDQALSYNGLHSPCSLHLTSFVRILTDEKESEKSHELLCCWKISMNPNFTILSFEAWTSDPSVIYFLWQSEIWAFISVNRKEEKGRHPPDDKSNATDFLFAQPYFKHMARKKIGGGERNIRNQCLSSSSNREDLLKDVTRFRDSSTVFASWNWCLSARNSISNESPKGARKICWHLLEHTIV